MSFSEERFCEDLKLGAEAMGIPLSPETVEAFSAFALYVYGANQRLNLTRILDEREMAVKHFLDSLAVSFIPQFESTDSFVDVGSGAGFPGIPLKLYAPDKEAVLLDSVGKKVAFLQRVIQHFQLKGIQAVHGRAEELALTHREDYGAVLCRGVGSVGEVCELGLPLLRVGGVLVIMKGPQEEPVDEGLLLEELGGALNREQQREYDLPFGLGVRRLIVVEKVRPAREKYPRRAGMARKRPLF